jgi:phenylalanyl-tRNA synthetase beta chain
VILFVVDGTVACGPGDRYVAELLINSQTPVILGINKIDEQLNFFTAKGFIENFLSFFENKNFQFEKENQNNLYFHPGKQLKILEGKKVVGYFGEIHPKYKKLFSLKQNIYLFELNLESISLKNLKSKIKIYEDYSKYPSIIKDLSLIISKQTNFYTLKLLLLKEIKCLRNVNFFDIYFDNNLMEEVSLGIRFEFQSFEKTLINEEIENEMQNVKNLLKTTFFAELK